MASLQAMPERIESTATSFASLPEELIVEIAEHLAGTYALQSLSALNITCRAAHAATISVLYRSLILVTRDPEGFAEQEKELVWDEGKAVSQGWKFVKYLFVGKENVDKLEDFEFAKEPESSGSSTTSASSRSSNASGDSVDPEPSQNSDEPLPFFAPPFGTLFPNLVLLLLRLPEMDRSIVHPQHARHYHYDPEPTTTTKISAHIYQPIKPSDFVHHTIMGSSKRETFIADSCVGMAIEDEEEYVPPGEEGYDPRNECVTDVISKISFLSTGEFLEEVTRPQYQRGEDKLLMVDTWTMDDDDTEGSRSRRIARGVLSFLAPRPKTDDDESGRFPRYSLPNLTLLGYGVPFQPFLTELLRDSPLKAELRVENRGQMLTRQQYADRLRHVAEQYHAQWEHIGPFPSNSYGISTITLFCCPDQGLDEQTGAPMGLSGLLTADPRKHRSGEADPSNTTIDGERFNKSAENGFEVMLITNGLLPPFPFTMNRWFYQVKPTDLPLDVLGVVAEFLAGAHAFGTLASLNIASHDVHELTLPILYETLLLDDFENLTYYRERNCPIPAGCLYTRFCVMRKLNGYEGPLGDPELLVHFLPNIIAMIVLPFYKSNGFNLYLHQPCTLVTTFKVVFQSPLHSPPTRRGVWSWVSSDPASHSQPPRMLETLRTMSFVGDGFVPSATRDDDCYATEGRAMRKAHCNHIIQ